MGGHNIKWLSALGENLQKLFVMHEIAFRKKCELIDGRIIYWKVCFMSTNNIILEENYYFRRSNNLIRTSVLYLMWHNKKVYIIGTGGHLVANKKMTI